MPQELVNGLMQLLLTAIAAVASWLLYESKRYITALVADVRAKHTADTVALLVDAAEMLWNNPKARSELEQQGWNKLDMVLSQAKERGLNIDRMDVEAAVANAKDVWQPTS